MMSFDAASVDLHGEEDLSFLHWRQFFLVVGAEWGPAVFRDWGVPDEGWAALRERARAVVRAADDAWAQARGHDLRDEEWQALQQRAEDEIRAVLAWAAAAFGAGTAKAVHEHGLLTPHTTPEFLWASVLYRLYWAAPDPVAGAAGLGVSAVELAQLRALVDKYLRSPSPVDFVKELDASDQSDWATTYFRGTRAPERENVVNTATMLVERGVVRALWSELRSVWPVASVERLVAWGHAWAEGEDIPVEWMPEPP